MQTEIVSINIFNLKMPNSFLSHQAPGLLIKMKYPKRIDGTAIYLSAFVPDLNFFLDPFVPFPFRHVTHSFLGLLIWVAPITIILAIIFSKYVGPRISEIVKGERKLYRVLTYFGFDELSHLKKKQFNKRYYIIAFYSALIGGFTHLLLDLPSHKYIELFFPWAVFLNLDLLLVPLIDFGMESFKIFNWEISSIITLYIFISYIEDVILLGTSLFLLRKIKKHNLIERWYTNEKFKFRS